MPPLGQSAGNSGGGFSPVNPSTSGIVGVCAIISWATSSMSNAGAKVDSCAKDEVACPAAGNVSAMADRNQGNVGHDYVREQAREEGGDYCDALKRIMQTADKKSKLFKDAKATWKNDCRGKR